MTNYQTCHTHYGYLTHETAMAHELLERCGKPNPRTVKELRRETDMPMEECARMLRCMWRDMELERLQAENAKLRELLAKAGELIVIAGWPDVECDEMASAVMHDIRELEVAE